MQVLTNDQPVPRYTMLLLGTFKVRVFLKIENRWLAYVQMRYQLEPRRQSIDCDPQPTGNIAGHLLSRR